MTIKILFFGILTDITKTDNMELENINSISKLKEKLFSDFPELKTQNFQISVNKKFVKADLKLNSNDEIALLPPFTGG